MYELSDHHQGLELTQCLGSVIVKKFLHNTFILGSVIVAKYPCNPVFSQTSMTIPGVWGLHAALFILFTVCLVFLLLLPNASCWRSPVLRIINPVMQELHQIVLAFTHVCIRHSLALVHITGAQSYLEEDQHGCSTKSPDLTN